MKRFLLISTLTLAVHIPAATAQSGMFAATGEMSVVRSGYTATRLADGTVLIAGGQRNPCQGCSTEYLATAEIYNPQSGTFALTGSMITARSRHSATLLNDGRVLVAGGSNVGRSLPGAEVYDPQTGAFQPTGDMTAPQAGHAATLLANGKVLIAGGTDRSNPAAVVVAPANVYDPATGTFAEAGDPGLDGFYSPTATLLPDGRVLLIGPAGIDFTTFAVLLYDPDAGTFSQILNPANLPAYLDTQTATLLASGEVLIAGGSDDAFDGLHTLRSAELFDPSTGAFNGTGGMRQARQRHSATLLPSGLVLIAGGSLCSSDLRTMCTELASAELYDPSSGTFVQTGDMLNARTEHTATLLRDGRVLILGGFVGDVKITTTELYIPAPAAIASLNPAPTR
jgi:Kelch motif protein